MRKYAFLDRKTGMEVQATLLYDGDEDDFEHLFVTYQDFKFLEEKYNIAKWSLEAHRKPAEDIKMGEH